MHVEHAMAPTERRGEEERRDEMRTTYQTQHAIVAKVKSSQVKTRQVKKSRLEYVQKMRKRRGRGLVKRIYIYISKKKYCRT